MANLNCIKISGFLIIKVSAGKGQKHCETKENDGPPTCGDAQQKKHIILACRYTYKSIIISIDVITEIKYPWLSDTQV